MAPAIGDFLPFAVCIAVSSVPRTAVSAAVLLGKSLVGLG
jgi:hypothetical protein